MNHLPLNLSYKPDRLRRANEQSRFCSDIYFLAESERDNFCEAEIITSKQYRYDQAVDLAFERGADLSNVAIIAHTLQTQLPLLEFIETLPDTIRVVINVDRIDGYVIQQIIMLLTHVQQFIIGERIDLNVLKSEGFN